MDANSIDLLTFLVKLSHEMENMTFTNHYSQKIISKLHKYLDKYHSTYPVNCVIKRIDFDEQQKDEEVKSYLQPG